MNLKLSDTRYELERIRYSFIKLLADFGGFNDGLILIASFLVCPYSHAMFMSSFSQQFSFQHPKKKSHSSRNLVPLKILKKLKAGKNVHLSHQQAEVINAEIIKTIWSKFPFPFLKHLICAKWILNRQDRHLQMKEAICKQYQEQCDVRNLINVSVN